MDIVKSFKVFQLVAQEQSFSRAADSLNLVPSAVSRQINELEHWLGVRLLNRTTRTVHLTKEGSDYLAKTGQIIELVDALKFKKNDHKNIEGKLKISAPMMLGLRSIRTWMIFCHGCQLRLFGLKWYASSAYRFAAT